MSVPYNNGYGNQYYPQPTLRQPHQGQNSLSGQGQGQFIPNTGGMGQQINQQLPSISNSIQEYAYHPLHGVDMVGQQYYQQRANGPIIAEAPIIYQSNIPLQVEPHMQSYQVLNYQNTSVPSYPPPYVNVQQHFSYMQSYPPQHFYQRPGLLNKQSSYDSPTSIYEQSLPIKGSSVSTDNLSSVSTLEKDISDGAGHYTPTQTKKNSRPRIHKLNRSDRPSNADVIKSNVMLGELSADELCYHFKDVLKIHTPFNGGADRNPLITNELEYQLFDLFVNKLSKSLDLFLPQDVYSRVVPEIALQDDTGMVMNAIYCFSSLILQRIKPKMVDSSLTIKYYHQSIKSVRYYLNLPQISDNDNGYICRCLLSTVILCIYELFFVAIDSTYIKGASSIFFSILTKNKSNISLLKKSPFYQACFWTMFYCDLVLSLKFSLPMMYAVDEYWHPLDRKFFELFSEESLLKRSQDDKVTLPSPDKTRWWMYKSLINFSLVCNFKNQVDVLTKEDSKSNRPYYKWLELKAKVDDYELKMPLFLKPTIYEPSSSTRIFPIVYFKDEAIAVTVLHLNLARIMLYESLVSRTNSNDPLVQAELSNYPSNYCEKLAKDAIGILKTYDRSPILWPGNFHPLRNITSYFTKDPIALKQLEDLVHRFTISCNLRVHGIPFIVC